MVDFFVEFTETRFLLVFFQVWQNSVKKNIAFLGFDRFFKPSIGLFRLSHNKIEIREMNFSK